MAEPADPQAASELAPLVYDELRAIARGYFRKQPDSFTLRPTDIVNEACLHLLRQDGARWESPAHFRAIATRKMWQVIVDHLKQRYALKRRGAPAGAGDEGAPARHARKRLPLDAVCVEWRDRSVDLLDLADALDALAGESRRLCDTVMLHWFGGLTYAETAHVLGLSASTVEKDFRYALAWLNRRLLSARPDGD